MTSYPIHTNLNTSFVNLASLVRHLRGLQFVGSVQIELSSYEAEIEFADGGSIAAREQDLIAGRLSFGEDALHRIMIRSTEPGGRINVYKGDSDSIGREAAPEAKVVRVQKQSPVNRKTTPRGITTVSGIADGHQERTAPADTPIPKPDVLFECESTEKWTELLALVSELLQTIDESLAKGNIRFADLFRNASGFISFEYPFLDPDSDVFAYSDGYISVRKRLPSREFISGIMAALVRITERLREDPYFGNLYHQTMHRIRVLANRRKLQFEMFGLDVELQKITGI
ncbi:MAG: hypothetical protein AB7P09_11135 [Pyrinomonadaceae bacterium]